MAVGAGWHPFAREVQNLMNASEMGQMYVQHLMNEGYRPTIDGDGRVIFKHEGGTYFIQVDPKDDHYFQLVFPSFWSIDSSDELAHATMAANHATALTKVAKVFVLASGDQVSATIELFLERPDSFEGVLGRAMSALRAGVTNFAEKMKELQA